MPLYGTIFLSITRTILAQQYLLLLLYWANSPQLHQWQVHAQTTSSTPTTTLSSTSIDRESPTSIPRVISVKDGQTTQEEIAPAYIIVGVVLVIIVIIMLCIGANWLSRRRNRKLFNTALKSFDEPNPVNYAEKMSSWTETQLSAYTAARTFLKENPPQCNKRDITPEERELIDEQGVAAWRFIVPQPSEASCRVRAEDTMPLSAYVHQGTDISFNWQSPPMNTEEEGGDDSSTELTTPLLLQTNMPIPQHRSICYFEVKLAEKPTSTEIGIGVTTRPYPDWRMPGFHTISAGYLANEGLLHVNNSFEGREYGGAFFEGDVIGVCINTRAGGVLFTRNGVQLEAASAGMTFDLYPTVAANGPCTLEVNFGQSGFVFLEANINQWGFASVMETAAQAPPAYGSERGSILLETAPSQRSHYPSSTINNNNNNNSVLRSLSNHPGVSTSSLGSTARTGRYLSSSTTPEVPSPLRDPPYTASCNDILTTPAINNTTAPSSSSASTSNTSGTPPPPYMVNQSFVTIPMHQPINEQGNSMSSSSNNNQQRTSANDITIVISEENQNVLSLPSPTVSSPMLS